MSDSLRMGSGMQRTAAVLLRATGGRSVTLCVPRPAATGSLAEELGLATPSFDALEFSPVSLRALSADEASGGSGDRWEMLADAGAAGRLAGSCQSDDVLVFFGSISAVIADGMSYEVLNVSYSGANGVPYLYRLVLQASVGAAT